MSFVMSYIDLAMPTVDPVQRTGLGGAATPWLR
jgi:hypothetical protein